MKFLLYSAFLLLTVDKLCLSGNAPVFSLQTCEGGCKNTVDCPSNAACIPILGQSCGVCLCTVGYTASGDKCVSVDSFTASVTTSRVVPSVPTTDSVKIVSITEEPIMNASPPDWPPLKNFTATQQPSAEFTCETKKNCDNAKIPQTHDENPFLIKTSKINMTDCIQFDVPSSVNCPNLVNGGQCVGGDCLNVSSSKSYCICPNNKVSPTCQEDKSGQCSSATGIPPKDSSAKIGKKFLHKRDSDYGAILARHYANSLKDCIRLCQWATSKQCRSVNYGKMNGKMVCELLTIVAKPETILNTWLIDDPAWTYFCCF